MNDFHPNIFHLDLSVHVTFPSNGLLWSSLTETPTQRRYTGQIQDFDDTNMQLYFYNARYYDPELARFTQADTIVPDSFVVKSE